MGVARGFASFQKGYLAHTKTCPPEDHRRSLGIQGYLAQKKQHLPKTLQYDYAQSPMVALEGGLSS
jgi:hypothetical protein